MSWKLSCTVPRGEIGGNAGLLLDRNESEKGPWFSVTSSRSYKQGEEWKQSDNFGKDDILPLCKLLDQAHSWILNQQQQQRSQQAA